MNIIKKTLCAVIIGGTVLGYNAQAEQNPLCSEPLPELTDPNFVMQLHKKVQDCNKELEKKMVDGYDTYFVRFSNNEVEYVLSFFPIKDDSFGGLGIAFINEETINPFLPSEGYVFVSPLHAMIRLTNIHVENFIARLGTPLGKFRESKYSPHEIAGETCDDVILYDDIERVKKLAVCHNVLNGVRDYYK